MLSRYPQKKQLQVLTSGDFAGHWTSPLKEMASWEHCFENIQRFSRSMSHFPSCWRHEMWSKSAVIMVRESYTRSACSDPMLQLLLYLFHFWKNMHQPSQKTQLDAKQWPSHCVKVAEKCVPSNQSGFSARPCTVTETTTDPAD